MAVAPSTGRLTTGAAAVAVAAGAAVWRASPSGTDRGLWAIAVLGVVALVVAVLFRRAVFVTVATVFLGGEYVIGSVGHHLDILATVGYAACLLVALELAWWSMEQHRAVAWTPATVRRRALELVVVGAGGVALTTVAGFVVLTGLSRAVVLVAVGAVAAPAAVWLVAAAVRSATSTADR